MLRDDTESGVSPKRREVERAMLLDSPTRITLLPSTDSDDMPPYGAQHHQDALWKGGNEVLPPRWHHFKVGNEDTQYQDDNLYMTSWDRPVRLDGRGQLIPGCEWHISPLGRSYFVNHNTRTTSWKKPTRERPAGSLTPDCVIEARSRFIWSLAFVGTSYNIISALDDGSIRRWTRYGDQVGKPWDSGDGKIVGSLAVSPDEKMVVSGSSDGKVRLWNTKDGSMVGDLWEGHGAPVRCLAWSPNSQEIASGSQDGTVRRWNPHTHQQITPTIKTGHDWVLAVKYSPQGDRFTSGGSDDIIRVWTKDGKLLIEIKGHDHWVNSLCWSKDGAHIFSGSSDGTIRKWRSIDGEELVVLRGHTSTVRSHCLSPDERHLVSASRDNSVRIWDLKTNQPVGDPLLHDDQLIGLAISFDGRCIASAGLNNKIYLWSTEAVLKQECDHAHSDAKLKGRRAQSRDIFDVFPTSKEQTKTRSLSKYGNAFWVDDTKSAHRYSAPPSPLRRHSLFSFLRSIPNSVDASQSAPLQRWHWNLRLFTERSATPTVVAPARDEDRYGIAPPTEEEVAAAMQESGNMTSPGKALASAEQGFQVGMRGQPTQATHGSADTGELLYVIGCCGFVVHRVGPRHTSH